MRDWEKEKNERVQFIKNVLASSGAKGIVFGNSGGKDSALVGALASFATENVLGVMLPCSSKRSYGQDFDDAAELAKCYGIKCISVDLTPCRTALVDAIGEELVPSAAVNIAPRLRMTTLYAVAAQRGYLVAGTGNKSERYMGYFTKWGDGGFDLNPISDLTATEVIEFLRYIGGPDCIVNKAPSAGLFDGQTDEADMGVTYREIDDYLAGKEVSEEAKKIIERYHKSSLHKINPPTVFKD